MSKNVRKSGKEILKRGQGSERTTRSKTQKFSPSKLTPSTETRNLRFPLNSKPSLFLSAFVMAITIMLLSSDRYE